MFPALTTQPLPSRFTGVTVIPASTLPVPAYVASSVKREFSLCTAELPNHTIWAYSGTLAKNLANEPGTPAGRAVVIFGAINEAAVGNVFAIDTFPVAPAFR